MNKIKKVISSIFILTSVTCICVFLYIIEVELGVKKTAQKYFGTDVKNEVSTIVTDKELQYLRQLAKMYYTMNPVQSSDEKTQFLKPHFSAKLHSSVFPKYKQMVSFFIDNNGQQTVELEKVDFLPHESRYDLFFKVVQKIPKKAASRHLVYLKAKIEKSSDGNKVTFWEDKILSMRPKVLEERMIFLKKGAVSSVKLPCKILSVAAIENENQIEANLDSMSNLVKFHSKEELRKGSIFRANCKKRYYDLKISDQASNITLFQKIALKDGILKKRILTPAEKRRLSVRRQLRKWGIEEIK